MLSAKELFYGYANGIFPMADTDGTINWYSPNPRAIIPIHDFKPSKSLRPLINKNTFEIRINSAFKETMENCALPRFENDETWISTEIIEAYTELHLKGFAHSVEAYQNKELVGGLYGVSIGAAFFGESMFFKVSNASKIAFYYLIEILKKRNFILLDSQFINDNVARYGAIEIERTNYEQLLDKAINKKVRFTNNICPYSLEDLMKEKPINSK